MNRCEVCPQNCKIDKAPGLCGVRIIEDGKNISLNYGKITAMALDDIEKKPLYHFYPGKKILSVGSFGCNLDCPFCQNYRIAHPVDDLNTREIFPDELVYFAKKEKVNKNIGLAFTYNEPLISYEYILDTAKLAKKEGLKIVVVTNGFISDMVLDKIIPYIDGWNIDIKGDNEFYKKLNGFLDPVKNTIEKVYDNSHLEITHLLIEDENDSRESFIEMVDFISNLDEKIPLHISRFFPGRNWMDKKITSRDLLLDRKALAKERLNYVYLGNI